MAIKLIYLQIVCCLFRFPQSRHTRSNFVVDIKKNISQASDAVGLSWVKAGIPGDKTAYHFAKLATVMREELIIPALYSYLKRRIKEDLILD
ncbi:hypothetical protein AVEN_132428-1 [Araneus ventricosus]|uniref:Uncharacterized protein n=1 Tax=Araneus ventricosus TaxID=182803 RepID=A0A4Y2IIZ2_ARAVE|nr:hypothetical protein AVEN_132428-1 [Araneus ventricosus]